VKGWVDCRKWPTPSSEGPDMLYYKGVDLALWR
jgi:hypothetical protein